MGRTNLCFHPRARGSPAICPGTFPETQKCSKRENVLMFWLAPVFQSKPRQQFLDWCLTGRNGWARWSQGLRGICVFNLVCYFEAKDYGVSAFLTWFGILPMDGHRDWNVFLLLGNRVGLVIVPRIVLLTKKMKLMLRLVTGNSSLLASSWSSTLWWWPTWYPQIIGTKVGLSGSGPQSVSHVQYLGMMAHMQGTNKWLKRSDGKQASASFTHPLPGLVEYASCTTWKCVEYRNIKSPLGL